MAVQEVAELAHYPEEYLLWEAERLELASERQARLELEKIIEQLRKEKGEQA
jgi:hypothetical protein